MHYRFGKTSYEIVYRQELQGLEERIHETRVAVDGVEQPDNSVRLVDDGEPHRVDVMLANERPRKSAANWAARMTAKEG